MRWNIGSTPSINRMSVLEAPLSLICIGYRRESSDISGEAEKWSNSEMRELGGMAGNGIHFMKQSSNDTTNGY